MTKQDYELHARLVYAGITLSHENVRTLRRAALTLHRWGEAECGDSNAYQSWAIERDETTGKPFRVVYPHQGKSYRTPIADREAGALKRVAALCKALNLHYYHQGDCRGAALYIGIEPLTDQNYNSRGVYC